MITGTFFSDLILQTGLLVHQRIHAAGNFGWLESINGIFFFLCLELKTVLAEMSHFPSHLDMFNHGVCFDIHFSISFALEVCLDLSKCCFKAELWAEVFCHYLLFVGITGEIFLWSLLCINTCCLGTMQDYIDTGGTLIPWLLYKNCCSKIKGKEAWSSSKEYLARNWKIWLDSMLNCNWFLNKIVSPTYSCYG